MLFSIYTYGSVYMYSISHKLMLYTYYTRVYYDSLLYILLYVTLSYYTCYTCYTIYVYILCISQSKAFVAFLTELLHPFKRVGNYSYIYQHILMLLAAIINDDPSMPALLNHFYDEGVLKLVLSVATQV